MNWPNLLERMVFMAVLLGLPAMALYSYVMLLVRHREQLDALHAERTRAREAARLDQIKRAEAARLADPLFRFRRRAPEVGVLHPTSIEHVRPGMILGRDLSLSQGRTLAAGHRLDAASIELLRQAQQFLVPIFYEEDQGPPPGRTMA
ncbi:MAG: hypothetical protein HUU03_09620 [Planctomycetaceae bacterium]|nr:hypothetical protein [Planctomycetaceae bacterium]